MKTRDRYPLSSGYVLTDVKRLPARFFARVTAPRPVGPT